MRSASLFTARFGAAALLAFALLAATAHAANIKLGVDVLAERGFDVLQNKRVGLLTHPPGVDGRGVPTVQLLRLSRSVNLVALFGPEHGIYGNEKASVPVLDKVDPATGLPVYSLYGKFRKPTAEMLAKIDVLAIDLQDVGVRSYTFASCMKLAIEACFERGVEVVVLDRPNPLGGLKVDGPPMDPEWTSYVGAFPVPYVHGLTMGELARMAVSQPGILNLTEAQLRAGKLTVVTMDGWRRHMSWPATGLKWIPTSPNVPDFPAAVGYAMTGLGAQLGNWSHGVGYEYPFRILNVKEKPLAAIEAELNRRKIPGVRFVRMKYNKGQSDGLYVEVTDWNAWRPTELSFHMMQIAAQLEPSNPFAQAKPNDRDLFNKHTGSTSWWNEISQKGAASNLAGFLGAWDRQAKQFQLQSRRYWLYD